MGRFGGGGGHRHETIDFGAGGGSLRFEPTILERNLLRLATGFLVLLAVCALGAVVWSQGRGFDITDNGFYLLTAQHPREVKALLTSAHAYTAPIWRAAGQTVTGYRLAGVALLTVAALLFASGIRRVQRYSDHGSSGLPALTTYLVTGLGALLYFGWTLPGPSYNLLNAAAMLAAAGLLLSAVADRRRTAPLGAGWRWAVLGAGLALGLSFFCRFPSAIGLLALALMIGYAWLAPGERLRFVLWLASGLGVWGAVHFVFFQDLTSWYQQSASGFRFLHLLQAGYGAPLLHKYQQEFELYRQLAWSGYRFLFLLLLILGAIVWWVRRRRRGRIIEGSLVDLALITLLLLFAARSVDLGYQYGGDEYYRRLIAFYLSFGACLAGLLAVAWLARAESLGNPLTMVNRRSLSLIVLLLALPMLGAAGTGGPISLNMMLNLAPWFGLFLLMLGILGRLCESRLVPTVGTLVLALFACSQIVTAGEVSPYRLNTALSSQTVPTVLGVPPSTVRLDPATSQFFESLRGAADECGFVAGDDILAFFNMPGVVFALGGRSPGGPWYNSGYAGDRESNAFLLELAGGARVRAAYVLENAGDAEVAALLAGSGARFPHDYRLCGSARWPLSGVTVRLWKPVQ